MSRKNRNRQNNKGKGNVALRSADKPKFLITPRENFLAFCEDHAYCSANAYIDALKLEHDSVECGNKKLEKQAIADARYWDDYCQRAEGWKVWAESASSDDLAIAFNMFSVPIDAHYNTKEHYWYTFDGIQIPYGE